MNDLYRLLDYESLSFILCKSLCMISDSLSHSGSFNEPISRSQGSDVIQAAINYVWFREIQMQKLTVFLGFCASTSTCQSVVLIPPHHQHYHLPSSKNHISMLLILLKVIRCQVTSAPEAESCFNMKWGISEWVCASANCTWIHASWPLQLICSVVEIERKAKGI